MNQVMTRAKGVNRSYPKWEIISKNTLKDLRVLVNLQAIQALMKKEVPHRKGNQKSRRNDVDLKTRKPKRISIGDINLHHHHQVHLMMVLIRVKIEAMKAKKAQIPDLRWFLRKISTSKDEFYL